MNFASFHLHTLTFVLPLLIVSVGSLVLLVIEVLKKGAWPRAGIASGIVIAAFLALARVSWGSMPGQEVALRALYFDPFSIYTSGLILLGTLCAIVMSREVLGREGVTSPGEYYALMLMSTAGALIFVSAAELITFFLGLEIMSMALYALCGSALQSQRSSEAALKYFFLGSFSSAFLLFGIALVYGLTGTTQISELPAALQHADQLLLAASLGLFLVGLIFKTGAVPFHFWVPDVYQGAPTPVTAYMACVIKVAAVGAALRVLWSGFGLHLVENWTGAIWLIALLTMVLGNLVALRQRSLKRMLAYSSIAHAGYLLVAFLAPGELGGGAAILYYLLIYTLMTMGAFGVVIIATSQYLTEDRPDDITRLNGLSAAQPVLAALMALFMLSLAGLPPALGGLVGKFYIFNAAVRSGFVGLAIVGVLCSVVSCYYYLRVIVAMYFLPEPVGGSTGVARAALSPAALVVLIVCGAGVVFLGMFPSVIYDSLRYMMLGSY